MTPALTASAYGQAGTGNNSPPTKAKLFARKRVAPLTVTRSKAPTDEDERKSFSLDRYHFRKDGAGYECREVVGKGSTRKRPYLAYLSRATLDAMKAESQDEAGLTARLIEWAKAKKAAKQKD